MNAFLKWIAVLSAALVALAAVAQITPTEALVSIGATNALLAGGLVVLRSHRPQRLPAKTQLPPYRLTSIAARGSVLGGKRNGQL